VGKARRTALTPAEYASPLGDGAVIDDIQLTRDRPVQDVIRDVSQLG
jgi:hypothetical protein